MKIHKTNGAVIDGDPMPRGFNRLIFRNDVIYCPHEVAEGRDGPTFRSTAYIDVSAYNH